MAAKILALVCVQFALFNVIQGQCLKRFPGLLPKCGSNILPVTETIIPNKMVMNGCPQICDCGVETFVSNPVALPATTIIQDSTVANNLANTLQLLVVSNLLSNTLPLPAGGDIIVPSYAPALDYGVSPCGLGPYNYIY